MADGSSGASLAFEARDRFAFLQHFVAEYVRPDSFDSDLARDEVFVAREINLAHRAATETFFQQVP
jgi:hypothetical protein